MTMLPNCGRAEQFPTRRLIRLGTAHISLVVALIVTGCEAPIAGPADQCRDFVAGYCAKTVECAQPTDRARTKEDCDFYFEVNLSCESVRAVQGSMATCLGDIAAIDCGFIAPPGAWPPAPGSCRILVSQ